MKRQISRQRRRGAILVLSGLLMAALIIISGLVIDIGYLRVTRTQMQAGSDSMSLAAVQDLVPALGAGASQTTAQAETVARAAAVQYAAYHRAGDVTAAYADPNRDVRFGNGYYDTSTSTWVKNWGATPYNMVEGTLLRNQDGTGNGDVKLPLFLGGMVGKDTGDVTADSVAVLMPGSSFYIPPGSGISCAIMPFALDLETWEMLNDPTHPLHNSQPDAYTHDAAATPGPSSVTNTGDSKREGDLYPYFFDPLVPNAGNRGTVDIGHNGNSTQTIKRQIVDGVNEADLAYHPGDILTPTPSNPVILNGDTGLSAGFENELRSQIGVPKMVPIFSTTNPLNGNNADYTIVSFECIVMLHVELGGAPVEKHIYFQPATCVGECVVADIGEEVTEETSIFAAPQLIE